MPSKEQFYYYDEQFSLWMNQKRKKKWNYSHMGPRDLSLSVSFLSLFILFYSWRLWSSFFWINLKNNPSNSKSKQKYPHTNCFPNFPYFLYSSPHSFLFVLSFASLNQKQKQTITKPTTFFFPPLSLHKRCFLSFLFPFPHSVCVLLCSLPLFDARVPRAHIGIVMVAVDFVVVDIFYSLFLICLCGGMATPFLWPTYFRGFNLLHPTSVWVFPRVLDSLEKVTG